MDNLAFTIPLFTTFAALTVSSFLILKNDFKKLSVKMWMLLLFVVIGFVGVLASRIATGNFQWYFLLPFPVYIVLNILNTLVNKNRIIGQADIDIFNGTLSLLVPIIISMLNTDYGEYSEYADQANVIAISGMLSDLLVWLLLGFLLSLLVAIVRFTIQKISEKKNKPGKSEDVEEKEKPTILSASIAVDSKIRGFSKNVSDRANEVKGQFSSDTKIREESKKKMKLRGTKIPVCLSFIPLYYAAVYIAMTVNATF